MAIGASLRRALTLWRMPSRLTLGIVGVLLLLLIAAWLLAWRTASRLPDSLRWFGTPEYAAVSVGPLGTIEYRDFRLRDPDPRGSDVFDPAKPHTSLSACLSLSRDDTANVLLRHAYPRHSRLKDRKSYEKMFASVLTALESESRWRNFHSTGAIFQWLAELQEAVRPIPGAAAGNPETVHHVLTAQGWIQQRLGDKVTIVDWAGACGLNADYFTRLFKAHTGLSPKAWLIEARLQRATRLLTDPDATVEKTAGLCGFECPYHFSRTFKRRFGVPPASYRRVRQVRGFVDP